MKPIFWTDDRLDQLRQMFREKLTAAQMADKFGGAVSRNAVCGKLHRLGLTRGIVGRKAASSATGAAPRAGRATGPMVQKINRARRGVANINPVPFVVRAEPVDLPPRHIGILELTSTTCRYPFGDAAFTFCGQPSKPGSPYCGAHTMFCMNGLPVKKPPVDHGLGGIPGAHRGGGRAA